MATENTLSAVLEVLSVTVMVDGKIHPLETEEFEREALGLAPFVDDTAPYALDNITQYREQNWKEIERHLGGADREQYINQALSRITDEFLIPMVYASMCNICRCDSHFPPVEHELLGKAARLWRLSRKRAV